MHFALVQTVLLNSGRMRYSELRTLAARVVLRLVGAGSDRRMKVDDDAIAATLSSLHDEADLTAVMRCIELRHMAGRCAPDDHCTYRAFWIATTLRRSAGRRPYLPAVADKILAKRAWLEGEIRDGQARVAVEAAFGPEDEAPAAVRR